MNPCYIVLFLIVGLVISCIQANEDEEDPKKTFCKSVRPQHSLNLAEVLGMWYGSEIIPHTEGSPGTYYYDSCVLLHLSDITEQFTTTTERIRDYSVHYRKPSISQTRLVSPQRYLRLTWDERENNLEYLLNYNASDPGLWYTVGEQRGSMLNLQYQQFGGVIQVVKAVHDHMVLTFCDSDAFTFFTIVVTRRPQGLGDEDLRSIRSLLSRRGLSTDSIRKVCASGSSSLAASMTLSLVLIWLLVMRTN